MMTVILTDQKHTIGMWLMSESSPTPPSCAWNRRRKREKGCRGANNNT